MKPPTAPERSPLEPVPYSQRRPVSETTRASSSPLLDPSSGWRGPESLPPPSFDAPRARRRARLTRFALLGALALTGFVLVFVLRTRRHDASAPARPPQNTHASQKQ